MPKTAHLGEFDDGQTYTHKRVAEILDRSEEWVLENIVRPGNDAGVRCRRVGTIYFVTGEALRFWIDGGSDYHGEAPKPR